MDTTTLYSLNETFSKPKNLNISKMFQDSFGVINTNDSKNIEIQVFGANAYFIKSYPLHHSQKIIDKDNKSITFSLRLSITDDFIMELMKYSNDIKIIKPDLLKTRLLKNYKKAIKILTKK